MHLRFEPEATVGIGMDERSTPVGVYSSSVSGCMTAERVLPGTPPERTIRFSGTNRPVHRVCVPEGDAVLEGELVDVPLGEPVTLEEGVGVIGGVFVDEIEMPSDRETVGLLVLVVDAEAVTEGVVVCVPVSVGVSEGVSLACTARLDR